MSKTLVIVIVVIITLAGIWYALSGPGATNTYTTPSATPPGNRPAPQGNTYPPSASARGRVVFTVKDAVAGSMQDVTSVIITVDKVEAHSATQGWITVSTAQKQYDLLQLKQSGSAALLADVNLPTDTYDQIRLDIRTVEVRTGSTASEAKLPSHTLKIVGTVTVTGGKTSAVTIDFLADKSLHITGNGTFILAPVVKFETRDDTDAEIKDDESVVITGGTIEEEEAEGMDEKGEVKNDFELKGNLDVDANNIIHIKSGAGTDGTIRLKY